MITEVYVEGYKKGFRSTVWATITPPEDCTPAESGEYISGFLAGARCKWGGGVVWIHERGRA